MNFSFLFSKQNASKCLARSKLTLPTKANGGVQGPKMFHDLTSNVKLFCCGILAFALNFSFQGQSPLHSISVREGREGPLDLLSRSHLWLKQSHKLHLPWEAAELGNTVSQWGETVVLSLGTLLASFHDARLILGKVLFFPQDSCPFSKSGTSSCLLVLSLLWYNWLRITDKASPILWHCRLIQSINTYGNVPPDQQNFTQFQAVLHCLLFFSPNRDWFTAEMLHWHLSNLFKVLRVSS